jgi:hypothetical protein
MNMSEQFRRYVQQCVQLAERSGDDLMLRMAKRWLELDLEQRAAELEAKRYDTLPVTCLIGGRVPRGPSTALANASQKQSRRSFRA